MPYKNKADRLAYQRRYYDRHLEKYRAEGRARYHDNRNDYADIIVVDLETRGLRRGVPILGLAWADATGSGAEQWTGSEEQVARWQHVFDTKTLVFHNGKFDVRVLREHGFTIRPGSYHDTQIMAYVLDPTHDSYSLKNCAIREGVSQKLDYAPEGGWDNAVWDEQMAEYAEGDGVAEYELYHVYRERLAADQQALEHYLSIELPFVEVILEMEETGFTLDLPALERLRTELVQQTDELRLAMHLEAGMVPGDTVEYKTRTPLGVASGGMTGINTLAARPYCRLQDKELGRCFKGEWRLAKKFEHVDRDVIFDHCKIVEFNPNSGHHIAERLTTLYGWVPTEFTPTKSPKTDAETLGYVSETMPLAKYLVEYAEVNKVLTSFIEPFSTMHDNGVLRANFNQTVTKTGRLSSSNPNLQNVPTRSTLGERVRKLIVAPEGYSIVGIDLSNIEGRLLAEYLALKMGDMGMVETFISGVDFHQANADRWGVSRNDAKTLLYASLYGAGPAKIGGGDKAKGKALLKTLEQNAPSMFELKERAWKGAANTGGILHTLFGRRLVYPDIIPEQALRHAKALKRDDPEKYASDKVEQLARGLTARAQRQVFNALLQGTAADIIKWLTIEAMPLIYQAQGYLAAQVHDEILVYVPTEYAPWLRQQLTDLFTTTELLSYVPVVGTAKIGLSWLQAH